MSSGPESQSSGLKGDMLILPNWAETRERQESEEGTLSSPTVLPWSPKEEETGDATRVSMGTAA